MTTPLNNSRTSPGITNVGGHRSADGTGILRTTQGVVERKTTIPILSNLLVEAKESQLIITATVKDALLFAPSYTSGTVLLISPRFVYLVAGLCSLYVAVAPFLSSFHGPISFLTIGFWIGAVFLLVAASISPSERNNIVLSVLALFGSAMTTALLFYGLTRFIAFRMGYIHGRVQIGVYQPNAFDRLNQILTKPVLVTLLISSLASLLMSALITLRVRSIRAS